MSVQSRFACLTTCGVERHHVLVWRVRSAWGEGGNRPQLFSQLLPERCHTDKDFESLRPASPWSTRLKASVSLVGRKPYAMAHTHVRMYRLRRVPAGAAAAAPPLWPRAGSHCLVGKPRPPGCGRRLGVVAFFFGCCCLGFQEHPPPRRPPPGGCSRTRRPGARRQKGAAVGGRRPPPSLCSAQQWPPCLGSAPCGLMGRALVFRGGLMMYSSGPR